MQSSVLELLESRVAGRGDLPVFRASVLEVVRLGEDTQCAASDIARVILQDQGFAVKVLRIANSPYFNRSDHAIRTISRAVVLLGVEVIRDICLSLGFVEVFQRHHPWIDLRQILAKSYFTAVLTRSFAERIPNTKKEELFLAGLLQYLGPLAVAYYLPEKYLELQRVQRESGLSSLEAERAVLGEPMSAFSESLAKKWALPGSPLQFASGNGSSATDKAGDPTVRRLPPLSREISENLFSEANQKVREFAEILDDFRKAFKLSEEAANSAIQEAYSTSRNSSTLFGLEAEKLKPSPPPEQVPPDPVRARVVAELEVTGRRLPTQATTESAPEEQKDRGTHQLELLREISLHILENRDLATLFDLIMEGVQAITGCDRILLVLCNPNRTEICGRYGFGNRAEALARNLKIPFSDDNLFTQSLVEKRAILVPDAGQEPYRSLIPPDLRSVLQTKAFALSPLFSSDRLVGLFYLDNALSERPITAEDYQVFELFAFQANLGLDRHRTKL